CREVLANREDRFASHEQANALRTLVTALGAETLPDLLAVMDRDDVRLQDAALQLAGEISGETATAQWVNKMKQVAPAVRARIVTMLGGRGDKSALPALREALRDTNETVALAAIPALVNLAGKESAPILLQTLQATPSVEQVAAIKLAVLSLPLDQNFSQMIALLPKVASPARVALLEVLGSRSAHLAFEAVAVATSANERNVRLAAIKALESISQPNDLPRLIDLMLAAKSESEISALQKAIVTIAAQIDEVEKRAEPVLIKQKNSGAEQQSKLLQTLSRLGGSQGFEAVLAQTKNANADIRDAAIRAMTDWPEPQALPELLRLAREEKDLSYHVLALRGAMRLLGAADFSAAEKLRLYREAMSLARRGEEKKLVLAGLANVKSIAALDFVSAFFDEDTLSLEAALAAIKIAESEEDEPPKLNGAEIVQTLLAKNTEPSLRKKLVQHFEAQAQSNQPPAGFVALFNGRDLSGWKGLVENPVKRAQMSAEEMASAQTKADSIMNAHWRVREDGVLFFEGKGYQNICTAREYGDFELLCDWKIEPNGDSGLYLRGVPQVQIWDPVQWKIGSGGLYNNQKNPSKPAQIADRPAGEWNTFRIIMIAERVTVYLNDVLVVDNVPLENYWERESAFYPTGQIELQAHNSPLYFKNIFMREIPRPKKLFSGALFNGKDLSGWQIINGKAGTWKVENEILYTEGEGGGWLSTTREFENFKLELDFRVPTDGNSGVFLRAPHEGDPAYTGMEVQVLDDYAAKYAQLKPWQYCGSVYAVQAPAERASKQANEWQHYEIVCNGSRVQVTLNGKQIVDANLIEHMDKEKSHPGLKRRKGFIGMQNHSSRVEYRNITLVELE
ncbi:MAG: family 16 glycoside hydrolase, partial [candidate division KSB1 bacterium]